MPVKELHFLNKTHENDTFWSLCKYRMDLLFFLSFKQNVVSCTIFIMTISITISIRFAPTHTHKVCYVVKYDHEYVGIQLYTETTSHFHNTNYSEVLCFVPADGRPRIKKLSDSFSFMSA